MIHTTVQRTDGLTELEIKVLNASRHTEFGDALDETPWSYAVMMESGLDPQSYGGVLSSLIQKGFAYVWDYEDKGRQKDMIFVITAGGAELFDGPLTEEILKVRIWKSRDPEEERYGYVARFPRNAHWSAVEERFALEGIDTSPTEGSDVSPSGRMCSEGAKSEWKGRWQVVRLTRFRDI